MDTVVWICIGLACVCWVYAFVQLLSLTRENYRDNQEQKRKRGESPGKMDKFVGLLLHPLRGLCLFFCEYRQKLRHETKLNGCKTVISVLRHFFDYLRGARIHRRKRLPNSGVRCHSDGSEKQ